MEIVTHSRLLKFLVPSVNISGSKTMEPPFKIEKLNPKIESGVPGSQTLREPSEASVDKVETPSDNFVPVLKVTRIETALTKGELKLQKGNGIVTVNPFRSQVFSDVINGPQPLRTEHNQKYKEQDERNIVQGNSIQMDAKKAKTKIPVLNKFRQTADKIKDERRSKENINKEHNQANVPQRPRRSSIPKLRKMRNETAETKIPDEIKNSDKSSTTLKNSEENTKPEDEFEKLFEEIVTDPNDVLIQDTILPDSKVDQEILESSFEEIIHAYDENKHEPTVVAQKRDNTTTRHSKIPLNRSQSNDVKEPKGVSRRNSLKNSPFIEREIVKVKSINFSKPIDQPVHGKVIRSGINTTKAMNGNTNETVGENIPNEPLDTGNVELNKEYIAHEENTNIILNEDNKNDVEEGDTGLNSKQNISEAVNYMENQTTPNVGVIGDIDTKVELTKNDKVNKINKSEDLTFFKGKVNRLISRLSSKDDNLNHIKNELTINEIPKKKSVLSKVALFEPKEPTKTVNPKTEDKKNQMEIIKIITEDPIVSRKPKIIEEVLKANVRTPNNDNCTITPINEIYIQAKEIKITDEPIALETTEKYVKPVIEIIERHYVNNDNILNEEENKRVGNDNGNSFGASKIDKAEQKQIEPQFLPVEKEIQNERMLTSRYDKLLIEKESQRSDKPEESITKNRMRRLQSMNELNDQKLKRSKSVVDIELGETIKGKVHEIIQNFKSEKQEAAKKEMINVKERPRRKSVFEKIALFEVRN